VVIHDEDLERTTNGVGLVKDKTAAELAALDAGDGAGVPTFAEVVALAGGRMHFDVEIKGKHCEQGVLDVLAHSPQTRAAISSSEWEILANVRTLAPDAELWVLTEIVSDGAIAIAKELGATTLAVDHQAVSRHAMERAAAAGLEVMAWTVNLQSQADRLRELGVVAICTDDPSTIH
jgi:glycerophosphoryl diester phosphodiesterase